MTTQSSAVLLSVAAPYPGNVTMGHNLGRIPVAAVIYMKSGGAVWFQSPKFDINNVYMVISAAGILADVMLF
jgi:hypothetical protein